MHGLHKGYSYQDLLTAFLISENLHKKDLKIGVELKEGRHDLFDDVVLVVDRKKTKFQVKHSENRTPVKQADFTNSTSPLNLLGLSKSFLPDEEVIYVVATNRPLIEDAYFHKLSKQKVFSLGNKTFSINTKKISPFLKNFFIETSLPPASFDLSKPGSFEKELLESLRLNVGIGYYPNHRVTLRDAAGRLLLFASTLRTSAEHKLVERAEIFRYLGLNIEYGHIAQDFPFISGEYRLYRKKVVSDLQELISKNKFTVLQGLPGSGKSHVFDDLFQKQKADGILVAKHLCYLEPTDRLAQERILVDALYGNFIYQLESLDPKIAEEIRPYFAATKNNLERLIKKISESGKAVVLMVDGLDHINRVVVQNKLPPNLVETFIEVLLELELPPGSAMFIASQLSDELEKIVKEKGSAVYTLKPWDDVLVGEFTQKHSDKLPTERRLDLNSDIIKSLTEKTEGNPLYLTYALKEVISEDEKVSFADFISNLPKLNNDLNNYYKYLTKDILGIDLSIVQTLALLDFSISRAELGEMFTPALRRSIDQTLKRVNPLLKPGIANTGLRIYHESFRRFVIEKKSSGYTEKELYSHILEWLEKKGFYESQRAYRYLIPYLVRSKQYQKVYFLLKEDFVSQSLYYFHPVESIVGNLNKIADISAWNQDWHIYCKAVELKRAVHTYSNERLDSVDEVYNEAILNVLGVDLFCERLLFDGKRVFSKIHGILLCKKAEHAGGNPPWDFYDVRGETMSIDDDSKVYRFQEVESAHFLNLIRKSSPVDALRLMQRLIARNKFTGTEKRQIGLLMAEFNFVFGVSKHCSGLLELKFSKNKGRILRLAIAEYLFRDGHTRRSAELATQVIKESKDPSEILSALICGGDKNHINISFDANKLTESVFAFQKLYDDEKLIVRDWYQTLQIAARINPRKVKTLAKLVKVVDGWYRAWILYLIELSSLETTNFETTKKFERLESALERLNAYAHPFKGIPRAMDLYGITDLSADSFRRTLLFSKGFPNYVKILGILSNISRRTTSYLQGSSGGPLSGETYNSLLQEILPVLSASSKIAVKKLIEKNTKDGVGSSVYYDSSAFEYLKLASVCALDKKTPRSKEYLLDGCIRLVAYGYRKDVTLFEIVEPLKFIKPKDLNFAMKAFQKTYTLVESVWRHTDGKSTKWGLVRWLNVMIDTNKKLAIQVITDLVKKDPKMDWRVEHSTEYLCKKLLQDNIDPVLVASLYKTLNLTGDANMKVTVGLEIVDALVKTDRTKAKELFDNICESLYWLSHFSHVYEKENFSEVIIFAKKQKFRIDGQYKSSLEAQVEKKPRPILAPGGSEKRMTPPRFAFSGLSMLETRKLLEENSTSNLLKPINVKHFAEHLFKLEPMHSSDVKDLILSMVRNGLYQDEDIAGLITMKNIFKIRGRLDIAAFIAMLCFVYARGGDGWYSLADGKFNYLAEEATALSKKIAEETMANELSYLFSKSEYYIGPTRHLIIFFSGNDQTDLAKKIWEEAYTVIKHRLPISNDLDNFLVSETPKFDYSQRVPIEKLIEELVAARKNIVAS